MFNGMDWNQLALSEKDPPAQCKPLPSVFFSFMWQTSSEETWCSGYISLFFCITFKPPSFFFFLHFFFLSTDTFWVRIAPCPSVGLRWTMKLWDSLTTCLILLSVVRPSSLLRSRQQPESPLEAPPVQIRLSLLSPDMRPAETAGELDTGDRCKS